MQSTNVNLNFIKCFEVLAETLSFSEASDRLRLAQSNVSRQIKILEEDLGVLLFHRTRQGVSLTPEGVRFRNEILPLTRELNEKLSNFQNQQQEEIGEIKLGCFSEVGQSFFMPLCLEFQRKYPKISLEMAYESEQTILSGLEKSSIEFGIVSHPPIIEGLAAFPIMKQKIALVAPASIKNISKATIEEAPFAVYEKTDMLLMEIWSKHVSKRSKPAISAVVNSHRSIMDAVAMNGCFAALPVMSLKGYYRKDDIQIIEGYEIELPLFLVHPNSDWMPKKNQLFKQYMLKRAKESAKDS